MKWLGLACSILACSSDRDSGAQPDASSGGTGGADASTGGSGGGAGVGASAGAGGSAGSAGSAGSGPLSCLDLSPNNILLSDNGTELLREPWTAKSIGGTSELYVLERADRGYVWLNGTFAAQPWQTPIGTHPLTLGALLAPTTSALPGNVICFPSGQFEVTNASQAVRTTQAKNLGPCPGDPVAGTVAICTSTGCIPPLSGSIEGTALTDLSVGPALGAGEAYIDVVSSELSIRTYTDAAVNPGASGAIELGLIFTRPNGPFGGAVYCAGSGSTWDYTDGVEFELINLSRLGTCEGSPGNAELLFCL